MKIIIDKIPPNDFNISKVERSKEGFFVWFNNDNKRYNLEEVDNSISGSLGFFDMVMNDQSRQLLKMINVWGNLK